MKVPNKTQSPSFKFPPCRLSYHHIQMLPPVFFVHYPLLPSFQNALLSSLKAPVTFPIYILRTLCHFYHTKNVEQYSKGQQVIKNANFSFQNFLFFSLAKLFYLFCRLIICFWFLVLMIGSVKFCLKVVMRHDDLGNVNHGVLLDVLVEKNYIKPKYPEKDRVKQQAKQKYIKSGFPNKVLEFQFTDLTSPCNYFKGPFFVTKKSWLHLLKNIVYNIILFCKGSVYFFVGREQNLIHFLSSRVTLAAISALDVSFQKRRKETIALVRIK